MPLPDDIIIYPAHGAGSACGKHMSSETADTLGHQKKTNYALRADLGKEQFIREVLTGLSVPPAYFPLNVLMNKGGYDSMDEVLKRGKHALGPEAFEAAANETGALMLDTRDPDKFSAGFIPNSINIGINGNFAPWVGALIPDIRQPILIIADEGREEEVITRLARVGYDFCIGYLEGGFEAWKRSGRETDQIACIDVAALSRKQEQEIYILDVRKSDEYATEHLTGAENLPLDYINEHMGRLDKNKTYYVHCASGYRSVVFISILRARGFNKLINVKGGFQALKDAQAFELVHAL
jgi:rhodanese-related sulfurtransferase